MAPIVSEIELLLSLSGFTPLTRDALFAGTPPPLPRGAAVGFPTLTYLLVSLEDSVESERCVDIRERELSTVAAREDVLVKRLVVPASRCT